MKVELSREQATSLQRALETYGEELDRELVRTDKAELQHALKGEVDLLAAVRREIEGALKAESAGWETTYP